MIQMEDGTKITLEEYLKDPKHMKYFRDTMRSNIECAQAIMDGTATIKKIH